MSKRARSPTASLKALAKKVNTNFKDYKDEYVESFDADDVRQFKRLISDGADVMQKYETGKVKSGKPDEYNIFQLIVAKTNNVDAMLDMIRSVVIHGYGQLVADEERRGKRSLVVSMLTDGLSTFKWASQFGLKPADRTKILLAISNALKVSDRCDKYMRNFPYDFRVQFATHCPRYKKRLTKAMALKKVIPDLPRDLRKSIIGMSEMEGGRRKSLRKSRKKSKKRSKRSVKRKRKTRRKSRKSRKKRSKRSRRRSVKKGRKTRRKSRKSRKRSRKKSRRSRRTRRRSRKR